MTSHNVAEVEAIFSLSLDLLLVTDLQGTVQQMNPAWERTLGFTVDELRTERLRHWIHPDDRDSTLANLALLASGNQEVQLENRFVCRDGGFRWIRWNAISQMKDQRIVAVGRDVTDEMAITHELEEARNHAVKSFRDRTQFLINMSQEVRTPISAIVGMAGMLMDSKLDEQQREQATAILDAAEELLDVFNEILDYARLERGELEIKTAEVDLAACVREVLDLIEPEARRRGLAMQPPDWGEKLPVFCDAWRLQLVLLNLLRVAVVLAQKGGIAVTCALGRPDAGRISLDLDIRDTGAELHEEWVEQLFEPFAQRDVLSGGGASGSALGLTITRQLIELMGGSIAVTSESSGVNKLSVVIPFELAPSAELAGEMPETPTAPLPLIARDSQEKRAARVLVVEDNPVNQRLAVRMLENAGYHCDVADNGVEAIAAVRSQPYDLILMDARMPQMDGYTAATRIRHDERPERHVPIIAMTADAMPDVRQRCIDSGMDDYLTKPIHPDQLIAIIESHLAAKTKSPPRPTTRNTVDPIDLVMLREVTDDDDAFQRELASLFLSDVHRHLDAIADEANRGDLETVGQRAHSIKGAASHVGAHQLSTSAAKLETAARRGDLSVTIAQIESVHTEYRQARAFLERYFRHTEHSV